MLPVAVTGQIQRIHPEGQLKQQPEDKRAFFKMLVVYKIWVFFSNAISYVIIFIFAIKKIE